MFLQTRYHSANTIKFNIMHGFMDGKYPMPQSICEFDSRKGDK
jgi:hypothetical protein